MPLRLLHGMTAPPPPLPPKALQCVEQAPRSYNSLLIGPALLGGKGTC